MGKGGRHHSQITSKRGCNLKRRRRCRIPRFFGVAYPNVWFLTSNHHFGTKNDPPMIYWNLTPVAPHNWVPLFGGRGVKTSLRIVAAV